MAGGSLGFLPQHHSFISSSFNVTIGAAIIQISFRSVQDLRQLFSLMVGTFRKLVLFFLKPPQNTMSVFQFFGWKFIWSNINKQKNQQTTKKQGKNEYPFLHNHGSAKLPEYKRSSSSRDPFSTSMIMGGRVGKIPAWICWDLLMVLNVTSPFKKSRLRIHSTATAKGLRLQELLVGWWWDPCFTAS